jgi:hypothetical protein
MADAEQVIQMARLMRVQRGGGFGGVLAENVSVLNMMRFELMLIVWNSETQAMGVHRSGAAPESWMVAAALEGSAADNG